MLANERVRRRRRPAEVVEAEREKLERYRASSSVEAARALRGLPPRPACRLGTGTLRVPPPCPHERSSLPRGALALAGGVRARADAALLADLGEPQRRFPAIHVVGTNGKTSTTLMTAALLRARRAARRRLRSRRTSRGWAERIQVDGEQADLDAALARVRPHADGATQFEVLTAAAFAEFAAARGRRRRRRGRARRPARRDERARCRGRRPHERRARAHRGARRHARGDRRREARRRLPGRHRRPRRARVGAARPRAPAPPRVRRRAGLEPRARASPPPRRFLGRPVDPAAARRAARPRPARARARAAARALGRRPQPRRGRLPARRACPPRRYTIVASILADKDAEGMLAALAGAATRSSRPARRARARSAEELAALAARICPRRSGPSRTTLARARELAGQTAPCS